MKNIIVTTSINPPTEAISKFDEMLDWELVVIGDLKTPRDYKLRRGHYISPAEQEKFDKNLSDAIGWNCIQRRNFGLLIAAKMEAEIVAVIDDDNIPYADWGQNVYVGKSTEVNFYETQLQAFDPIGATNHPHLWHRGFPLQLISERNYQRPKLKLVEPDIQADFWNGDPDIDAICRLEHRPECNFDPDLFPLMGNTFSPFNSQNTFLKGTLLKDYFLFPHIGRMDDIWASYYIQALGASIIYGKPSVYQDRNAHDLIKDMKNEYLGYENNLSLVMNLKENPDTILKYLPPSSIKAFNLYKNHF